MKEIIQAVSKGDGMVPFFTNQEWRHPGPIFIDVYRQEFNPRIPRVALRNFGKARFEFLAGSAPRRPEAQHDPLAFPLRKRQPRAIELGQIKIVQILGAGVS